MKTYIITALFAVCISAASLAGIVYGPTVYKGDVSLGSWAAHTNLTAAAGYAAGGTYTNASPAYTNYYRISATNALGRIPLSSNIVVTFTGNTNAASATGTNAVTLTWRRYDGITSNIIERSHDAGSTWTNWYAVAPTATNWTDLGTNALAGTNSYTNAYITLIPAPTVPWGSDTLQTVVSRGKVATNENVQIGSLLVTNTTASSYMIIGDGGSVITYFSGVGAEKQLTFGFAGFDFDGLELQNIGDPAGDSHAMPRSYADTRYQPIDTCDLDDATGDGSAAFTNAVGNAAWASQRTPYRITSAPTVTVQVAWLDLFRLDATNDVVLQLAADITTTNYSYDAELEIYPGTHTIGFDTNDFSGTTLIDISGTNTTYTLNFTKPQRETRAEVRQ